MIAGASGDWIVGREAAVLVGKTATKTFVAGTDLPGTQITTAFEDRSGAMWIGTNAGVARVWQGRVERAAVRSDADSAAVLAIAEDASGDVWIGTETAGVEELRPRLFVPAEGSLASSDHPTTSVVQTAQGVLWAGTNGAGLTEISPSGSHTYSSRSGLTSDIVLALAAGGEDASDVWVGTPDGLDRLHANRWTALTSSDGLADDLVRSLLVARDGAIWVGSRRGVTRWKDGHATILTKSQSLGSDLVGPMLQDPGGDVWIGTSHGLARIHGESVHNYTGADGLPGDVITALAAKADGGFWVAAEAHGLGRWDGQRFERVEARGVPQHIFGMVEDGAGSLWLRTDRGILRIRVADLEQQHGDVSAAAYGPGDGLTGTEMDVAGDPSLWKLKDGRIAIATRRGIVIADAPAASRAQAAPPVAIEEVTVDGRNASREELASLPPNASQFAFSFAGIHLAAPQHVQYRYMLQGLDNDWIEAGTRRTAYYTNIPRGHYVFRVAARIAGGDWSSPADMPVSVRPHLYETAWFRVLLAMLVLLVAFAIYRLRVRSLQGRFAAVTAERSRLAREIHDTLAQSFVAVSVRLEVMSQMLRGGQGVDACREQLDQTRALVRDSLAEARRSIWNLRADGATAQSLPSRLSALVQQVRKDIPAAQLETSGTYRPLASATEDELFRIAQEAANNAVRHAGANSLEIKLSYALESVSLEVKDDGRGFDVRRAPSRGEGHFGITGIRERARILK
ncbi:MAG TPA: two-component regulator propeller domain-containing protein, partial [Acidobacteriaceae bacterium]|nr:two-component regulator propeller domain-containing protein [Acidobacteriaceae bacterium]